MGKCRGCGKTIEEAELEEEYKKGLSEGFEDQQDDRYDRSNPDSDASIDAEMRRELESDGYFSWIEDMRYEGYLEYAKSEEAFKNWLKEREKEGSNKDVASYCDSYLEWWEDNADIPVSDSLAKANRKIFEEWAKKQRG